MTAPAFAQDNASTATSFTGARAEVFGGYQHTESRYRGGVGAPVTGKHGKSAAVGGVEAGYDFPLGDRATIGPMASYSINTTKNAGCIGGATSCIEPKMDWAAGARVGYKAGDTTLLYAKGSYVQTQEGIRTTVGGVRTTSRDWKGGWRAGVGVEHALSPRTYVKAEYDYTQTKRFGLGQQGFTNTSLRQDRQALVAGVGMRF